MNVQNVETNESHFMTFESVEDLIDFFPEFWDPEYENSWHIRDTDILNDWIKKELLVVAESNNLFFAFKRKH